jgi:hypothetical protein
MCTILTVNRLFWDVHARSTIAQINLDAITNSDGWSLVCIDPDNSDNDLHIQSMNVGIIKSTLTAFMGSTDNWEARMWLHARAATGFNRGIAYCHGFTDLAGQFVMHNGIITSKMAVDSFSLSCEYSQDADRMLRQLVSAKETFANVFLINEYEYSVLRVSDGQLHTDEEGNFSTKAFGPISTPVPHRFVKTFVFDTKEDELDYFDRQELYRDSIPYYNQQTSTSFPDYIGNSDKPKVDYRNNLLSAPATDFDITDDFTYPEAVVDKADTEAVLNSALDDKALADYIRDAAADRSDWMALSHYDANKKVI